MAKVNGLDVFAGLETGARGGELGEDGSVGVKGFAGGKTVGIRAMGLKLCGFGGVNYTERSGFGLSFFGEIPSGVVIFVALGIYD